MRHLIIAIVLSISLSACQYGNVPMTYVYREAATINGHTDLKLDFFSPSDTCTDARPTVVYVHEGSFYKGGRGLGRPYADAFLDAGFNFVALDYRKAWQRPIPDPSYAKAAQSMRSRADTIPGYIVDAAISAIEDTVIALAFLEEYQADLCHDANRVVLMGTSAGAVIGLNVTYALDDYGISRSNTSGLISNCGGYMDMGTMQINDTPLLHFHGEDDDVIPFDEAELIWDSAISTDTPMQFLTFENQGHCPDWFETKIEDRALIDWAVDFSKSVVSADGPLTRRLQG